MRRTITAASGLVLLAAALVVPTSSAIAAPTVTVSTFEDTSDGRAATTATARPRRGRRRRPGRDCPGRPDGYALTLTGGGSNAGDVDLARPVDVGTGETGFLDASGLGDRVFDVSADVTLHHLAMLKAHRTGRALARVRTGRSEVIRRPSFGTARTAGRSPVARTGTGDLRPFVTANTASGRGGGLYARGPATISRSTFSENRAAEGGGGVRLRDAAASLADSTISATRRSRAAGSMPRRASRSRRRRSPRTGRRGRWCLDDCGDAQVSVRNTVFDGNRADAGRLCVRPFSSGGHNVADVFGCGLNGPGDLAGVDPMLGGLRQNGGPTPTHALAEEVRRSDAASTVTGRTNAARLGPTAIAAPTSSSGASAVR